MKDNALLILFGIALVACFTPLVIDSWRKYRLDLKDEKMYEQEDAAA